MENLIDVRIEAVIFNEAGDLLLAFHKTQDIEYWVLPGAKLAFGEKIEECASNKLKEFLDIDRPNIKELLFIDEFIEPEINRHSVKIGFRVEVSEDELDGIVLMTDVEIIKDIRFFSAKDIDNCEMTFCPSKDFLIKLLDM